MGNRAVITTPQRKVGLYLHWNGAIDTIEPLLKYCELKGYRPPGGRLLRLGAHVRGDVLFSSIVS